MKSLSITKRLTILYTVSAFILLAISAVFLDWVLISDMAKEDKQFLASEVQNLSLLIREHPGDMNAWKEEIERETTASATTFIKYYIRILDRNSVALVETLGMAGIVGPSSFPALSSSPRETEKIIKQQGRDGRPLFLISARVKTPRDDTEKLLIQIALDMSHEDAVVAGYRKKAGVVLVCGVLLSAMIGFIVSREGLRPLKSMATAFRRIGPDQLHERVGSAQWPEEIAALADAFDTMLGRLEDSFNSLSRFSADLAHELRTPISNLRGEAEVALYKTRTPEEYRQVLESSLEEFAKLSRMIESLLFLARAESRDTLVQRAPVDGRKEIEAILEYYNIMAEEKGINVVLHGEATINADPMLFRQAIGNILTNAFQYTLPGGQVIIALKNLVNGSVQIDVKDTGIGIEPENLNRVFNRFYRTETARAEYPQGTGLGFAIVKSIMDLHNGTVSVLSEQGKGTTVTLLFF